MDGLPRPPSIVAYGREYDAWWFAPGRVNLLGEHIDYVGGTVLPMTLQYGTHALARPAREDVVSVTSLDRQDQVRVTLSNPAANGWGAFVAGAVRVLQEAGIEPRGTEIVVQGNLPAGGLSSSASLACVLLRALADVAGAAPAPLEIARWAQQIEHEYVGVHCGLMDQAAICLCAADAALAFDCERESWASLHLPPALAVLVLGTGVTRRLADSAYNERQAEARAALAGHPAAGPRGERIRRRGRHVETEMQRVCDAMEAIEAGDYPALGRLMDASHVSLRDDFEVSCTELDAMVEIARDMPGVLGARMTGAGFGGAAVALAWAGHADAALDAIAQSYRERLGRKPSVFRARSFGPLQRL